MMPEIMGTLQEIVDSTVPEFPIEEPKEVRRLATIRKVAAIDDIVFTNTEGQPETAANIVRATIDGWQLVTQRSNNFKPGDMVVYFEIDSLIPLDNPEFTFLRKKETETHHRLRTIKLKGQVSQGLVLPVSLVLGEIAEKLRKGEITLDIVEDDRVDPLWDETNPPNPETPEGQKVIADAVGQCFLQSLEGYDLTEMLGITKYELPIAANLRGKVKGNFPHFLRKTDEERIQNLPNFLTKYKGVEFYVTEKLDGSSFTAYFKDGVFGICSRNLDLTETEDNAFWQLARKLDLENKMKELEFDACIQGEMVGPGIQKNRYNLKEVDLYVFNVFNIEAQEYHSFRSMRLITQTMGLKMVPVLNESLELQFDNIQSVIDAADGPSRIAQNVIREGMVYRPVVEIRDDRHGRVSFKAISNQFLLKNDG